MKRLPALHVLFFAVYPVLFAYSRNAGEADLAQVALPFVTVVCGAAVLWVPALLVFRERTNASVALSLFLLWFFLYGHFAAVLRGAGLYMRPRYLLVVWTLPVLAAAAVIRWRRRPLPRLTSFLNAVSACLVALCLGSLALFGLTRRSAGRTADAEVASDPAHGVPAERPDIYYIILDRYAREDVLLGQYGYDNSEFLRYLGDKGFHVATAASANYPITPLSLASSLNMQHLVELAQRLGEDATDMLPLYTLCEDFAVWRFLQQRGYRYVHFGSGYSLTAHNPHANLNINLFALPDFWGILYHQTVLQPVLFNLKLYDHRHTKWRREVYEFDHLEAMCPGDQPLFVFAHFLTTHPPYVFRSDGSYVSEAAEAELPGKQRYAEQVEYANRRLRGFIDHAIASARVPPIIVLQADEGPYPLDFRSDRDDFDWRTATAAQFRQKFGILNACYAPRLPPGALYPAITPVNTFRVIFRHYFGAGLEPLPDTIYAFVDRLHMYKLHDVTDKARPAAPALPSPAGEEPRTP
ncbi:MAG TPA: hypothetical protein VNE39_03345 [Planctomycetota bacterium]|nr:hypothetical protein [Planctomycetota bacterium]